MSPPLRLAPRPVTLFLCFLWTLQPLLAEPWPLDKVAGITDIGWREGLHVSPDGQWLAYTVELPEMVNRSGNFTATGATLSSSSRRQARVTNLSSGETRVLGAEQAYSWAGTWSPTGGELAFFSDQSGRIQLLIYDLKSRKARPVSGVTPAVTFYFEAPRWSADGQYLALPCLPPDAPLVPGEGRKAESVKVRIANVPDEQMPVRHWRLAQLALVKPTLYSPLCFFAGW